MANAIISSALQAAASHFESGVPLGEQLSVTGIQALIMKVLRAQVGRRGFTLDELETIIGIPVRSNNSLIFSLSQNPKLHLSGGHVSYVSKFIASDRWDLLRILKTRERSEGNNATPGLTDEELADFYPGAERDVIELSRAGVEFTGRGTTSRPLHSVPNVSGGIRRIRNCDTLEHDAISYRSNLQEWTTNASQFIQLSGTVSVQPGSRIALTSVDLSREIFRNDVIIIDGRAFRVDSSSATSRGVKQGARRSMITRAANAIDGAAIVRAAIVTEESESVHESEEKQLIGDHSDFDDGESSTHDGGSDSSQSETEPPEMPGADDRKRRRSQADHTFLSSRSGAVANNDTAAVRIAEDTAILKSTGPALTLKRAGISNVSIANDVKRMGGHYSVADTAPHVLRIASEGYAIEFTSTQLPLDRPWDGPTAAEGVVAHRFGATGDLRVLWREVCTRSAIQKMVNGVAKTAATSNGGRHASSAGKSDSGSGFATSTAGFQTSAASVDAVLTGLGGAIAFRDKAAFPLDHGGLRDAMARVGLAKMSPMAANALKPKAGTTREKGHRKLNKRAFIMQSNQHVKGTGIDTALKVARIEVLKAQEKANTEQRRQ